MSSQLDSAKLAAIRNFFAGRESEIIDSICRLVEIESPSGDIEGSRAVVNLLEKIARNVKGGINRPPLERTAEVIGLYRQAREIAARLDFELGECAVGGASDGNFAAALGVPVLDGLGIEGDGAHAAHEHILITDIARRAAPLAGLVATL